MCPVPPELLGDLAMMLMPTGLEAQGTSPSGKQRWLWFPSSQGKTCEGPVKDSTGRGDINSALNPRWKKKKSLLN